MAEKNIYMTSRMRFEILDGLRGVAALMVVFFHCFESYCPPGGQQFINHGYLAVDFFFLLSGFVTGYAYDDRWSRMTVRDFFKRRLVRLHPMVIAGTVIGACFFFYGGVAYPGIMDIPSWKIALCIIMGMLLIPCAPCLDIRGWGDFFPLNCTSWTLVYEYIANILYALVFRHLPKVALAILCLCSSFCILDITLGWDVFGVFPDGSHYSLFAGWYLTPYDLYTGFSRLMYPFLCGLLISRILRERASSENPSGSPLRIKNGFLWTSILLIAILITPCAGGHDGLANGIFQAMAVLILFPLIVLAGAGSTVTEKGARICKWLGELSYPLFIVHYTLMYMQYSFPRAYPDAPLWIHASASAGVVVMSVILARCLYKCYDIPVRKWLTDHWLNKCRP